jgi:hypothetical protein
MKTFYIEEIAKKILNIENERKEVCEIIKNTFLSQDDIKKEGLTEDKIIKPVKEFEFGKITVAAVDGGMISKNFRDLDLILLRAVGVIFFYNNNKLISSAYYPENIVSPKPKIYYEPFYETELEANSNIERYTEEIKTAKDVVEKFKPDIIFLHGSIVPQYLTIPKKKSILYDNFKLMINSYLELFDSCVNNEVILSGLIEDSRSNKFCTIISNLLKNHEKIGLLNKIKDSFILDYILKFGERTLVFNYSPKENPILSEFGKYSLSISSFYVKNTEFDRPIRVEYLGNSLETADKIASILCTFSKNSTYAIPPVVIEADQRAKLSEDDFNLFYSSLIKKLGRHGLDELRRFQRPF